MILMRLQGLQTETGTVGHEGSSRSTCRMLEQKHSIREEVETTSTRAWENTRLAAGFRVAETGNTVTPDAVTSCFSPTNHGSSKSTWPNGLEVRYLLWAFPNNCKGSWVRIPVGPFFSCISARRPLRVIVEGVSTAQAENSHFL